MSRHPSRLIYGRRTLSACIATTFASAAFLSATSAWSQESTSEQASPAMEEITITARKRTENLQEVADAVSVINTEKLESADIQTVQDAARLTPSLVILDYLYPGTKTVSFRGFTTLGRDGEFPFSTIVDGVVQPGQMFFDQQLVNVEQIEILRGPQGTLYGGGAIAGAINIVTEAPSNEFEGNAKISMANGNTSTFTGNVSGPLVEDKLYYRLGVYGIDSEGLINNKASEKNADYSSEQTYRGQLLYTPTDELSLAFNASYTDGEHGALWLVPVPDASFDGYVDDPDEDEPGKLERTLQSYSVKVDYDFADWATFTSISAINKAEEFTTADADYSAEPLNTQVVDYTEDFWSQEFRLVSAGDSRLGWSVGLFYQDYETESSSLYGPVSSPQIWNSTVRDYKNYETTAVFGQMSYEFTDRIEATLGLRYDSEEQEFEDRVNGTADDQTFHELQPKVSVSYKISEDVFSYLSYARGYRKGGFNARTSDTLATYDPETADTYEFGVKSTLADGMVVLNGSVYYTNYEGQLFNTSRVVEGEGIFTVISNIEQTDVYGIEGELNWFATDALSMNFSAGYSDASIEEFLPEDPGLYNGNRIPQVYGLTAQAGFDYKTEVGDNYTLTFHGDVAHRGNVYWDVQNELETSPSTFVNSRVAIDNGEWTIAIFGRNLTDERVPAAVGPHALGTSSLASYNAPRQYGVELGVKF